MKIIFLSGPPGVGKDTAADMLQRHYDIHRTAFAQPLKDAIRVLLDASCPTELELLKRHDPRVRALMIGLSEDVVKPIMGNSWFADRCAYDIFSQPQIPEHVIVTDSGFSYEVEAFIVRMRAFCGMSNVHCQHWHITRPDHTYTNDSRSPLQLHPEEGTNLCIKNNGDPQQLAHKVDLHARAFLGEHTK